MARASDVVSLRNRTVRVNITNAATMESRKAVLDRYMAAYRETIDYMYSSPDAVTFFAEIAGVPLDVAQKMPGLVPKSALSPDQIVGMDAIMAEAIATKFMSAPLTKEQIAELVRMPVPPKIIRLAPARHVCPATRVTGAWSGATKVDESGRVLLWRPATQRHRQIGRARSERHPVRNRMIAPCRAGRARSLRGLGRLGTTLVEPAVEDVLGDAVLQNLDRAARDHPAAAAPHAPFHQAVLAVAQSRP